nr:ATP synthase F0 subunit 6 [Haplotrema minimum]
MMSDLFSSLDGCHSLLSWTTSMVVVLLLMNKSWLNTSLSPFKNYIMVMFKESSKILYNPLQLLLLSLFLLLMLNNLIGLTPFTYGMTSNLFTSSSLGLLLWMTILLSGWMKSPSQSTAHLAPSGAPMILLPFLVLIETISILIRPITLTVRLVANISAGHIVMGLIANSLSTMSSSLNTSLLMLIMIFYTLFEFFVSVIQAYIFSLLISLYVSEHP